jgi:hypothetical protein
MPLTPKFQTDELGKLAQLWITSVAGTALVIVIQSFGEDLSRWEGTLSHANLGFMLDRTIRYAFALWFGIYMVLAYLANEARVVETWTGLIFDVVQSVAVFIALGLLGFVTQDFGLFGGQLKVPLIAAFGTIFLIGAWTYGSHFKEPTDAAKKEVWKKFQSPLQKVRLRVAIVSFLGLAFACWHKPAPSKPDDGWALAIVLVLVGACLLGLYRYAVCAFQNDSPRHDPATQNNANLEAAISALNGAGVALETAGASLKLLKAK